MLIAPVAALVEKIGSEQVTEVGTVLVAVLARTVVAVLPVTGATLVVGATFVVVDGTFVVVGARVTGTAVAGISPREGVVVVDAATWRVVPQPALSTANPLSTRSPTAARRDFVACIKFAASLQRPIRGALSSYSARGSGPRG